jgi:hypothetical protein
LRDATGHGLSTAFLAFLVTAISIWIAWQDVKISARLMLWIEEGRRTKEKQRDSVSGFIFQADRRLFALSRTHYRAFRREAALASGPIRPRIGVGIPTLDSGNNAETPRSPFCGLRHFGVPSWGVTSLKFQIKVHCHCAIVWHGSAVTFKRTKEKLDHVARKNAKKIHEFKDSFVTRRETTREMAGALRKGLPTQTNAAMLSLLSVTRTTTPV